MVTILEKISGKTRNIKIVLIIFKILDIILTEKWFLYDDKETWSLIYLVNYIFDMHDIFVGSFIAERLILRAKSILTFLLETRKDSIN